MILRVTGASLNPLKFFFFFFCHIDALYNIFFTGLRYLLFIYLFMGMVIDKLEQVFPK